ncbi:aldo/keto reductase [Streptomyces sp. NPDC020898]|uniref:aldo/keto reductase n=1 Tax=Streptomyces sp. NPDC020898 TaxID=3365101 RepID=UPI00379B5541
MEHRLLGRTGLSVSEMCLGAMMFGPWGNPDHDEATRTIQRALDAGINFIDTADVYSHGESEEIVGRAIKGRRDDIVLATKFHNPMGDDPNQRGNSRRWIMRAVEDSLRRLGTAGRHQAPLSRRLLPGRRPHTQPESEGLSHDQQDPQVSLNNGVHMPILGFGVFQIPEDQTQQAVEAALEAGYRLLDTAAAYENERAVGRAIAASGIPREDLFITTKLWVQAYGQDSAERAFDRSLDRLGLDHLDLTSPARASASRPPTSPPPASTSCGPPPGSRGWPIV